MKKLMIICLILSIGCLAACKKEEETRTVEWYLMPENKSAWDAKLEQCRNNPGELGNTPNCINARKAFDRQFLRGGENKPTIEPEFGFTRKQ